MNKLSKLTSGGKKLMRRCWLKMNRSSKPLVFPYIVWAFLFIIVPLILIFYYGITAKDGSLTLRNIGLLFTETNRKALFAALRLSAISTLICIALGYPLAYILANTNKNGSSFVIMVFMLPMWMNFLLRTIAWQNILEKNGIINTILNFFSLPKLNLINTNGAIILGMVYNFLPFMIVPIYNVLIKIDINVINAARDLGANQTQTFLRITLPLSTPGIISGITMVFVPALTTFVISDILGGSKIVLIGNVIEQQFKASNDWHAGAGMSLVLMVFILAFMAVVNKYGDVSEGNGVC